MKIAHITNQFFPCVGGIEEVVFNLAKKSFFHSEVIALNHCKNLKKKLKKEERVKGIRIQRLPFLDLKYYKICFQIIEKIRNYDLLCIHGIGFFSDLLILTKFIHRKPIMVITHGGIFHTRNFSLIKKVYFNFFQRFILRFADKVLAVSESDKNIFSKIIPRNKIELIENGFDFKKFYNPNKKRISNKFIFFGRFSKNKRIDNLIKVFSELKKGSIDFNLLIVGNDFDNLEKNLKDQIKKLNLNENVKIKSKVSDKELKKMLDKSTYFVSASEFEGYGISVLEAMSNGLVPIVNAIAPFRTILNKEYGYLVNFSDPVESARKIKEIMKSKSLHLQYKSEKAKKYSFSKDWSFVIKQYDKLFSSFV